MNNNTKRINSANMNKMHLRLDNVEIPIKPFTKFLGLWVDECLNWKTHVDKLETRLKTKLCMLRRGQNLLTTHAKKVLYFAQIHSLLTYGLVIWGNMISTSDLRRLQKLQDKGVQLIANHRNLEDNYKENRILKIEQLITLDNIKIWYKCNRNSLPTRLTENMKTDHQKSSIEKKHHYNTRNKEVPNLPHTTVKKYKDSFLVKGLRDYQLTPQNIKDARNIKQCTSLAKH